MSQWVEFTKRPGERIAYEVTARVLVQQTQYQHLEIWDTVSYGRALFLDHKIQSAVSDEFIYHEALVHPAMLLHPAPRRVFIAGGGEGATLREVLRHPTVERVVMVDIDAEAVEACRRYLRDWHQGSFDDPRVALLHQDARGYLEATDESFDVVVVDVTDPLAGGPSYRLFTREFYGVVAARLAPEGALAVQAESIDVGVLDAHLAIHATVATVFGHAASYGVHVPSFGESWGFVVASRVADARALGPSDVDARLAARGLTTLRFYDGPTHQMLFQRPKYLRELLAQPRPIVTDDRPVVIP
ncbi:MAG TPA: polyamine aminopropyltransferase [Chloroflexota bacterium]